MAAAYAELQVTTNFSFLRGGSHPEELVETAILLGLSAIAVTDRNSLAGIVRGHVIANRDEDRQKASRIPSSSAAGWTSPTRRACCATRPTAPPMAGCAGC